MEIITFFISNKKLNFDFAETLLFVNLKIQLTDMDDPVGEL